MINQALTKINVTEMSMILSDSDRLLEKLGSTSRYVLVLYTKRFVFGSTFVL